MLTTRPIALFPTKAGARPLLGHAGEAAVARALIRLGYRVVAANLRTRSAEVDLVARWRRSLHVVEVKTRTRHAAPEETVKPEQRARLCRAAAALASRSRPRPRACFVDIVALTPHRNAERTEGVDRAQLWSVRHFRQEAPRLRPKRV